MTMKILVVEDDSFFAQQLKELLEDRGFKTAVAKSLEDALSTNLDDIAAILSDVMLPNDTSKSGVSDIEARCGFFSGVALFRTLRKRGVKIPLILFSGGDRSAEAATWASQENVLFVGKDEGPAAVLAALGAAGLSAKAAPPRAFIVHGHDDLAIAELKDYLQNTLKWEQPVVLREQPNRGRTIIEKFEEFAGRIDCVFVLLTPDDAGVNLSTDDERRRARQNVVFELGFFYAKFGRRSGRVIALRKGPIELPSDIQGIVWIDITGGIKAAGEDIRKEVAHIVR
jgi:predicted nucleotide-binding protein